MKNIILSAIAAIGILGISSTAQAATFVIDESDSSVSATTTPGFLCNLTNCSVGVDLADDFANPSSFDLAVGESITFDFITFDFDGGLIASYDIDATLAFDTPSTSASSGGDGAGVFIGSVFFGIGGFTLDWDDVPVTLVADGLTFEVEFEEGTFTYAGLGNQTVTTSATVTLISQVPLPASGLVLLTGFALLPAMRRRKTAA